MSVTVDITADPNNEGARVERCANLDAAASSAIAFGWTCTITEPREPLRGRPVAEVHTFIWGTLRQADGDPVASEENLEWWCRRASEPRRGSRVAYVTLRDAGGHVWRNVTVRGNGGLLGHTEQYRLEAAIANALEGHATGLPEPKPGHVRAYDTSHGVNMTPVDLEIRGAQILEWGPFTAAKPVDQNAIRALLTSFPIDVADAIAAQAADSARMLRRQGWERGTTYDIGAFHGDAEQLAALLGARETATPEQVKALEACIRIHLDATEGT